MVHITYIESQPESNPTIVGRTKNIRESVVSLSRMALSFRLIMNVVERLRLKQKSQNWQNIMSEIMEQVPCQVLAAHLDMNFRGKPR